MELELSGLGIFSTVLIVAVVALLVIGIGLSRLYRRSSKEMAFVRTGMGGQKVIMDAGALVLPVVHDIIPINMQTLSLRVERVRQDSLITKDNLRVDAAVEFFVRVKPDADSIAKAAQTLGRRTLNARELATLIEGKFVDALRSVAASMNIRDLHEKRTEFVQQVQNTVAGDLTKNGLELETVALVSLNQTDVEHFNPNNIFDSTGLKMLTEITQQRAKERNEIEADARVSIEEKNREANARSLEIAQSDEFARLEQERQIETRRAEQEAALAKERAEAKRAAELAEIKTREETQRARILAEQALTDAKIDAEKRNEISNQERQIAISEKSKEQSQAQAEAEHARAKAVEAQESVLTVEAVARAERDMQVAIVKAKEDAERDATRIRIIAEAELKATEARAQSIEKMAEAKARDYEVEAQGKRALNEADNVLSEDMISLKIRLALIDKLPTILEQMAKPIEKIDSFRVVHVGGMGGQNGGIVNNAASTGSLTTDLTNSLLNYRLQSPLIDNVAKELGIDLNKGMNGIVNSVIDYNETGDNLFNTSGFSELDDPVASGSNAVTAEDYANGDVSIDRLCELANVNIKK